MRQEMATLAVKLDRTNCRWVSETQTRSLKNRYPREEMDSRLATQRMLSSRRTFSISVARGVGSACSACSAWSSLQDQRHTRPSDRDARVVARSRAARNLDKRNRPPLEIIPPYRGLTICAARRVPTCGWRFGLAKSMIRNRVSVIWRIARLRRVEVSKRDQNGSSMIDELMNRAITRRIFSSFLFLVSPPLSSFLAALSMYSTASTITSPPICRRRLSLSALDDGAI